jgi:HEAT repeat protein
MALIRNNQAGRSSPEATGSGSASAVGEGRREGPPDGPTEGQADLGAVLRDGDADARRNAARALGADPNGTKTLAEALEREPDPRVREAIFTSLIRLGGRESVDAIIPYLRTDDANLRMGALDALRAMIDAARPVLPELLTDPDADVRLLTCDLLRELPSSDATALLCGVLAREQEANVCAAAVDVLADIGDAGAVPYLDQCAARFGDGTFLSFAVKAARERIIAGGGAGHG